jgi:hypothetical protein
MGVSLALRAVKGRVPVVGSRQRAAVGAADHIQRVIDDVLRVPEPTHRRQFHGVVDSAGQGSRIHRQLASRRVSVHRQLQGVLV